MDRMARSLAAVIRQIRAIRGKSIYSGASAAAKLRKAHLWFNCMSTPEQSPGECANCGAKIPRRAQACPECGADERTGWRDTDATRYDGLDLPDSAFADEPASPPARRGIAWYWYAVAALLVASLVLGLISFH